MLSPSIATRSNVPLETKTSIPTFNLKLFASISTEIIASINEVQRAIFTCINTLEINVMYVSIHIHRAIGEVILPSILFDKVFRATMAVHYGLCNVLDLRGD